eukprot:CCRYP_003666-RA/>CCRYP_003666-RA protein AED:0.21 eAED:0.21 QI:236/1/1/1/0/0/3/13/81
MRMVSYCSIQHTCGTILYTEWSWYRRSTAVLTFLLHTVEFLYSYVDMVCYVPLIGLSKYTTLRAPKTSNFLRNTFRVDRMF